MAQTHELQLDLLRGAGSRIVAASQESVATAFSVELRNRLPALPVLYLGDGRWSTPELEALLPTGVAILREPVTVQEVRGRRAAALTAVASGLNPGTARRYSSRILPGVGRPSVQAARWP